MVRIKILEDDPADRDTLIECLRKYEREQGQSFSITAYDNPSDFMDNYHMDADLIFMDIHLADGSAFSIFEQVDILSPVIFTTAYDSYALQAFHHLQTPKGFCNVHHCPVFLLLGTLPLSVPAVQVLSAFSVLH